MKTKKRLALFAAAAMLVLGGCAKQNDYSSYVTLGNYTGLEKHLDVEAVTDKDLEDAKDSALEDYTDYEDATGPIQEGQVVEVAVVVTGDGKELYNFTEEPYEMTVGKEAFGKDFDAYLIGKEKGASIDTTASYDEDFNDEVLCGKDVEIKGSVSSVKDVVRPTVDDAFVKKHFSADSVADWEKQLVADLEKQHQEDAEETMRDDLLQQAIDASKIDGYPKKLYEKKLQDVEDGYQSYADMFGCDISEIYDTFGLTKKDIEKEALDATNLTMVVYMIADKDDLYLSSEELTKQKKAYAKEQGYDSVDELLEDYDEDGLEEYFLQEAVKDELEQLAK